MAADDWSVRVKTLHLSHHIKTAPDVALHINMGKRLKPGAETTLGAPNPLGDCAHLAMVASEHCDDAVSLTEPMGAQHDPFVSICRHTPILASAVASCPMTLPPTGGPSRNESTDGINVRISPVQVRRAAISVLVLIAAAQAAHWAFNAIDGFLVTLLVAWLLAIALEPGIGWLMRRNLRRGQAAGIMLAALIIGVVGFFAAFGGLLFGQLKQFALSLPSVATDLLGWVNQTFNLNLDIATLLSKIDINSLANNLSGVAGGLLGIVSSALGALFAMFTLLFFVYYFAADGPKIRRVVCSLLPQRQQELFIKVWDVSVEKTGAFVVSRIIMALLSGLYHATLFAVIGVPYWFPLGLFTGLTSQFIPSVGTYIGIGLPILIAVAHEPLDAVWIIVGATVYQQLENLFIGPRLGRMTMNIHPAVALASVFIGAALLGPTGAVISVPVAAAIIAVAQAYAHRYELIDGVDAASADGTSEKTT